MSNVSKVPRSFSPAPGSVAGNMAPCKQRIKIKGNNPDSSAENSDSLFNIYNIRQISGFLIAYRG